MSDTGTMPENVWIEDVFDMAYPDDPALWYPDKADVNKDGLTPYRLKSLVDAERAADSKTIRQLANAANRFRCAQDRMLHKWSEGDDSVKHDLWKKLHEAGKDMLSVLDAHAQRIGEANE